ncbi:hypothetical protein [Sorangium sp. So ce233]|uniref:hypothetical protein n=1 Tax=Sorangium sp. So ce233 TaxID=3133290 RepID=UPI003F629A81
MKRARSPWRSRSRPQQRRRLARPVGAFTGLDADGAPVVRRELDAALDEAGLGASPALAEDLATSSRPAGSSAGRAA